jgi:hypothetical protein
MLPLRAHPLTAAEGGPGSDQGDATARLRDLLRLPKGATARQALAAVAEQFPFGVVAPSGAGEEVLELQDTRLKTVLDALARATETTWQLQGKDICFQAAEEPEPVFRQLRQEGKMRVVDEARAALTFLATLDPDSFGALASDGFLPYERLTPSQRTRLLQLPTRNPRPKLKGTPLAELPLKDLIVLSGFFLRVRVEPAEGPAYAVFLSGGDSGPRLDPFLGYRRAVNDIDPHPTSPRTPPAPPKVKATRPSDLSVTDTKVEFTRRDPPVYTLEEIVKALRTATNEEIFVDRRLTGFRVWLSPGSAPWSSRRLMELVGRATGFSWRRVGTTWLLVRYPHGERPFPSVVNRVLADEQTALVKTLSAFAHAAEAPELAFSSDPDPGKLVRWDDLRPSQQRQLRSALRSLAVEKGDERLAKYLWLPQGLRNAKLRFSPGIFLLLAVRPTGAPLETAWGVIAEATIEQP